MIVRGWSESLAPSIETNPIVAEKRYSEILPHRMTPNLNNLLTHQESFFEGLMLNFFQFDLNCLLNDSKYQRSSSWFLLSVDWLNSTAEGQETV